MLMDRGYQRVRPLEGGLEAWIADGGEVTFFESAAAME
jgi:3-mercaptopyruvate sulfurtransferase SseA